MPFPDEMARGVAVVDYHEQWPAEFECVAARIRATLGSIAVEIDHVGSTSVPGLAAKDCIDVQVRVERVDPGTIIPLLSADGMRCRPEPWNRLEVSGGVECAKLLFAPPIGERSINVHVRDAAGPNTRYALLFRDYLRADAHARAAWGEFKKRLSSLAPDLLAYGHVKVPATEVLMTSAECWARQAEWSVPGT